MGLILEVNGGRPSRPPPTLKASTGPVVIFSQSFPWVRERKVKSSSRPDSSGQTLVESGAEEEEIRSGWGQSKLGVLSGPHNGRACPPSLTLRSIILSHSGLEDKST